MFIGLKQWIWEASAGTMVSVGNEILVSTVVFILQDNILWWESYSAER